MEELPETNVDKEIVSRIAGYLTDNIELIPPKVFNDILKRLSPHYKEEVKENIEAVKLREDLDSMKNG